MVYGNMYFLNNKIIATATTTTTTTFIMTRIFTILQKHIHIKLKKLDNSNSANPQLAWANLALLVK